MRFFSEQVERPPAHTDSLYRRITASEISLNILALLHINTGKMGAAQLVGNWLSRRPQVIRNCYDLDPILFTVSSYIALKIII